MWWTDFLDRRRKPPSRGRCSMPSSLPLALKHQYSGPMKEKVIVITGASSGIGAALASHVATRGAFPVLVARREKELASVAAPLGKNALAVVADVTKRGDVERALAAAISRFGHVDVWVNNAGRGISRLVSEL